MKPPQKWQVLFSYYVTATIIICKWFLDKLIQGFPATQIKCELLCNTLQGSIFISLLSIKIVVKYLTIFVSIEYTEFWYDITSLRLMDILFTWILILYRNILKNHRKSDKKLKNRIRSKKFCRIRLFYQNRRQIKIMREPKYVNV